MAEWDRSQAPPQPNGAVVFLQVGLGIALVFLAHALFFGALFALMALSGSMSQQVGGDLFAFAMYAAMGLSCAQLIYVGPMLIAAVLIKRRPIALGLILGAAITVLLQGSCYGLFLILFTSGPIH